MRRHKPATPLLMPRGMCCHCRFVISRLQVRCRCSCMQMCCRCDVVRVSCAVGSTAVAHKRRRRRLCGR
uniref:Uncharacterized protein n=1 Tax=Arundo donax TaxID=35708 RepID=A0A0A8Z3M4_ARUDO